MNKINKDKGATSESKLCRYCGKTHAFVKSACTAFGKTCKFCKKKNHTEKVCRKKKQGNFKGNQVNKLDLKLKNQSSEDSSSSDSDTESVLIKKVYVNESDGSLVANIKFYINNKWKELVRELDTGARSCVMGYNYYCRIVDEPHRRIQQLLCFLMDFGKHNIKVLGETIFKCIHKGKEYRIKFRIVDEDCGPLLSVHACMKLNLIEVCNSVQIQNLKKMITQKQKQLSISIKMSFKDGLLPGVTQLQIDETVKPVIQKPRRIPMSYRKDLKEELSHI